MGAPDFLGGGALCGFLGERLGGAGLGVGFVLGTGLCCFVGFLGCTMAGGIAGVSVTGGNDFFATRGLGWRLGRGTTRGEGGISVELTGAIDFLAESPARRGACFGGGAMGANDFLVEGLT